MKKLLTTIAVILCICLSADAQWDKDVFSIRGRLALQDGKYASAIDNFNIISRLDTTDYWNYFYRGIAKYNLGDIRGAQADFDRSIKLNPVFTNGYHFRAITKSRSADYESALADISKALELRPGNLSVIFSRGVTNFLAQNFKEALEDFNYYIKRESKDASAYLNRGATHLFLQDTVSAINDYNKAIKLDPHDAEGYIRRGRVYAMQNDIPRSIADMNSAIERDPDNTLAYFTRAIMYHDSYDYNAAMADFNKVLEIEPGNALTLYNRSLLNAQVGDYEAALSDIDRVIAINPDNVLAHYNRAAIYMELERYQDAIDDYSTAIDLYPDFAKAYMNRSVAEQRIGKMSASRSDYKTAKKKIEEYRATSKASKGSYADTTQKYNSLLKLDAEFARKGFDDELLQHRDIDVKLRPLYRFALSKDVSSEAYAITGGYENLLLERFIDNCPLGIKIVNDVEASGVSTDHAADYLISGDSSTKAGKGMVSAAQTSFIKGLIEVQNKHYNTALACFEDAVAQSDKDSKDRYAKFYKAFYLINRSVLRADMIEFISSMQNNVQTLAMDDKKATRTLVNDRVESDYDYSEAIEDILAAIEILPDFPYSYFNLGNLYCLSSKPIEAISNYSKAIEIYPHMGEAYYNRGLVQISVRDKEKGCIDLSKAGELGVGDAYAMINKYCVNDEN